MAANAEGTKGKLPKRMMRMNTLEELLQLLEQSIDKAKAYCKIPGTDIDRILTLGKIRI